VLFTLLYLGIGLMGLWIGLARRDVPPFTARWLRDTVITFLLISTIFLPALIFIVRSFFTKYGPFEIKQPGALELYQDKIRYRFPRGSWQERPARDLECIILKPLTKQGTPRYALVLEFAGDKRLIIGQERAAQFGESPEQMRLIIERLYRK
jgi:hypothetical protein